VSAAVQDLVSGQTWLYNAAERAVTASVMKVDILETVLHEASDEHPPLAPDRAGVAEGMIERSDNKDAQQLWDEVGGGAGVGAFNASAGLTDTELNTAGYWGISTTSVLDQIRLLRELAVTPSVLNRPSRAYELHLMENVEPDQAWGVSAGVAPSATVALKNGWLPTAGGWEVNSVGYIKGDGRSYLIAVLTADDPDEAYGINTISRLSQTVWNDLASPKL
jgi:beta-lactamase class A